MAAYAALVSVMQIIDQIQRHHRPPISLHEEQTQSMIKLVTFLQDFLEDYNPYVSYTVEVDPLESRIAEAAYAAEDVIESYIVDQILARHKNYPGNISSAEFYQVLQKVTEEMDLIKMEVVEIKQKMGVQIEKSVVNAGFLRSTSTAEKVPMVGFDDVLYEMLEKVCRGPLDLQIIPIVGIGGIGKTTLAQNTYVNSLVEHHFHFRAWLTISQNYNALEILRQVLNQVDKNINENLNEYELGEQLFKCLIGRRYLIVMDDMWSIDAWDRIRRSFPDNRNGSRVVVTTRISNLASQLNCGNRLEMKFLDEASSLNLFSKTVFGEQICPIKLVDIGKKIVEGCKRLPLSIAVIGGLLSKTRGTRKNWKLIEENLNSIVNLEDNERCLQILYTSYNNLPVYLKPCFLYMGMYPEDTEIQAHLLIMLWVAEGFVKPFHGKTLEEIGNEFLEELVDRNLILVENRNNCGDLVSFKIHDLLRDLSLREAQKLRFLHVFGEQSIHDVPQRRIVSRLSEYPAPLVQSLESASFIRSLIGTSPNTLSYNFILLRVSMCDNICFQKESIEEHEEILLGLFNLRYLLVDVREGFSPRMPSSVSLLWNLQTIILLGACRNYVFEIWKMPQLRHVMTIEGGLDGRYCFPHHPPLSGDMHMIMDDVVMENLQTLSLVINLNIGEELVKRIPNIIRLNLYYNGTSRSNRRGDYCLNNLSRLHKLETLSIEYSCIFQQHTFIQLVTFPYSLKDLRLEDTKLNWEDMQTKIGPLPLLQVLHLKADSCIGFEWETFEGQFSSLKFLLIEFCLNLKYWKTDNTHFPRLEELHLRNVQRLSEIPLNIGNIPTLRSIKLDWCSDSVVDSARRIQEEQEAFGNEDLKIQIR